VDPWIHRVHFALTSCKIWYNPYFMWAKFN